MGVRRWTLEEDEILRIKFGTTPVAEIAKELGRSPQSLRSRAMHGSLGGEKQCPRNNWSEAEDSLLRLKFDSMSIAQLAAEVGRSYFGTRTRALKVLGLRRGRLPVIRWSEVDDNKLRELFAGHTVAEIAGLICRSFKAVETRVRDLGLRRGTHDQKPLGTERLFKKANILKRLVSNDTSALRGQRWRSVHVLVWEQANGPVPAGSFVCFRLGLKTVVSSEITLDRLELVTAAMQLSRHDVNRLPSEVTEVIRLRANLNRAIRKINKGILK